MPNYPTGHHCRCGKLPTFGYCKKCSAVCSGGIITATTRSGLLITMSVEHAPFVHNIDQRCPRCECIAEEIARRP
ncbi:hypothetical protein PISMIDRAFT_680466 [Pisolithus microcarpus 441]|uniref:Uncharacterized protein n=1 Tax=Pisolithus microcarpus 441 TaxID=765257 RepID=A0A0C9YZQ0_9AGAM|nr:hypothetical protein PISMIDRAFT_680466 [Pisolithus microcarpus 441]